MKYHVKVILTCGELLELYNATMPEISIWLHGFTKIESVKIAKIQQS